MEIEERGNIIQKFVTDKVILSPPKFNVSDYKSIYNYSDKLIFIERNDDNYIPCIFYRFKESSNFLIYFHGNSEHIFNIDNYGLEFRSYIKMNILLVEYPGYSIYENVKPNSNSIFIDTLIIFNWLKEKFKITEKQIFICGRSIGTSPAIYLASNINPQALILISPFTSIKNIGKDFFLSFLVEEIFKSNEYAKKIKCPVLIIHGKKDILINYYHSIKLKEEIDKNGFPKKVELKLIDNMTHNKFNLKEDIIYLIKDFINSNKLISVQNALESLNDDELKELYKMPLPITILIESKIFTNINELTFSKKIKKENANFMLRLMDKDIALINGSKISIYNYRNYNLEQDINVNQSGKKMKITALIQMKNENLICGTDLGDIFIFEKDYNFEEFQQIKSISLNEEEIFKIEKFSPNFIYLLTNKTLKIYNNINFNEIFSINLPKIYLDLVQTSNLEFVTLSQNNICFNKLENKTIKELHKSKKLKISPQKGIIIATNQYLLLGGNNCIYYWDLIRKDYKINIHNLTQEIGIINYFNKIHDKLFLASTLNGNILQIIINKNNELNLVSKIIINKDIIINSLILKNYNTILFSDYKGFQVWTSAKKKNNDKGIIYKIYNIFNI